MKKIKPMNFKGAKNASQFYHRVQIKLKCLSFALKPEHFSPNDVYFCQMGNILATRQIEISHHQNEFDVIFFGKILKS